jgi:hypothetical protein
MPKNPIISRPPTGVGIDPEATAFANVFDYGAKGDDKTDDTDAFRKAIDSLPEAGGVVIVPAGNYRLDTLELRDDCTLRGTSTWSYRRLGGCVLKPLRDDQPTIVDARKVTGFRIERLTFDGEERGDGMHGLVSTRDKDEQDLSIEDCCFVRFSGSGARLHHCWAWHVRHSFFHYNGLDGLDISESCDGFVTDSIFAGNGRYGVGGRVVAAATFTGCRVEWNVSAGIRLGEEYMDSVQIAGGLFDANYGPAIEARGGSLFTLAITGNVFRRNGQSEEPIGDRSCHVYLDGVRGVAMTGNTFLSTRMSKQRTRPVPEYGLTIRGLADSTITGNALYHAAVTEILRDHGGHGSLYLEGNPGSVQRGEVEM